MHHKHLLSDTSRVDLSPHRMTTLAPLLPSVTPSPSKSNAGTNAEIHRAKNGTPDDVACRWLPYYSEAGREGVTSHWPTYNHSQTGIEGEAGDWLQRYQEVQELMQGNIDNSMLPNHQRKAEWENALGQAAAITDAIPDGTNWEFLPAGSSERPQPFSFAEDSVGPSLQPSGHLLPTLGEELQLPTAFQLDSTTDFRPWHQSLEEFPWTGFTAIGSHHGSDLIATLSTPLQESHVQNLVVNDFSPNPDAVEPRYADITVPVGPNSLPINLSTRRRTSNDCLRCAMSFTRPTDLTRHVETQHTDRRPCDFCGKLMAVRRDKYKDHLKKWHKMNPDVASKYSHEWQ